LSADTSTDRLAETMINTAHFQRQVKSEHPRTG